MVRQRLVRATAEHVGSLFYFGDAGWVGPASQINTLLRVAQIGLPLKLRVS